MLSCNASTAMVGLPWARAAREVFFSSFLPESPASPLAADRKDDEHPFAQFPEFLGGLADPIWREVRLLAVQGRRFSPTLDAFVKVARSRYWSREVVSERRAQHSLRPQLASAVG